LECCEALDTGMKEDKDSIQYLAFQNGHMLLAHMNATYVTTVKVKITEHLDFL